MAELFSVTHHLILKLLADFRCFMKEGSRKDARKRKEKKHFKGKEDRESIQLHTYFSLILIHNCKFEITLI